MFRITGARLALLISVASTALVMSGYYFYGEINFLKNIELKTLDLRFRLRGPKPVNDDVVIVAIDDYSIELLGRWPWPRSYHAEVIDRLSADGAKAIGFDLIFTEAEENPELLKLRQIRQYYSVMPFADQAPDGLEFGQLLDDALETSQHDRILGESLARNNNVAVTLVFLMPPEDPESMEEEIPVDDDQPPPELLADGPPAELWDVEADNDQPPAELLADDMPPPELLDDEPPAELWEDQPADDIPAELLADGGGFGDLPPLDPFEDDSAGLVPAKVVAAAIKQVEGVRDSAIPVAEDLMLPLSELYTNAKVLGHVNNFPDIDGYLRWSSLLIEYHGRIYPSFAAAVVREYLGLDDSEIQLVPGKGLALGSTMVPLDEQGKLLLNFYGPAQSFQYVSYADVIEGTLPPGTFKDKIVLIGGAATGLGDVWPTPFSRSMVGVEKHATAIGNILDRDFLHRTGSTVYIDLLFILIGGLLTGFIVHRTRPVRGAIDAVLILLAVCLANYICFVHFKTWINLTYPAINIIGVAGGVITYRLFTEEKDKKFLKATFSQYISPELIDTMYESKVQPELGGSSDIITAYFTDIQGFSTFSEKLTAHQLVELLNEYLTVMTDILLDEQGTLDKYEGDAIIAFFGAPMRFEDHALRACRVAIEMQNRLLDLREKWRQEQGGEDRNTKGLGPEEWAPGAKWPTVVHGMRMRIGANTGEIVTGNMGSSTRKNYTMMGDSVNLAARLEAGAKQYGIFTIISEFTYNHELHGDQGETHRVADFVEARFIDNIQVVGKSEPVRVYELVAMKGDLTEDEETLFKLFSEAMDLYLTMQWDAAIARFEPARQYERFPDAKTTPSDVYIKRCQAFKENPPVAEGETWDGVWRLTSK